MNEVIISFRPDMDVPAIESFLASNQAEILRRPSDLNPESYLVRFGGQTGHGARALSNRLDQDDRVAYAQPNFVVIDHESLPGAGPTSAACEVCPDSAAEGPGGDPFFDQQWHLNNPGTFGRRFMDINALRAWSFTRGKPEVVIAILDDWVEREHEDLAGRTLEVWNAFDPTGAGSLENEVITGEDAHGTAAAGLAAATFNNGAGVTGIAPKVTILPIRMRKPGTLRPEDVVRAINHAAQHADVLSMSWTLGQQVPVPNAVSNAIRAASKNRNRVLVISAGKSQGTYIGYPANLAEDPENFPIIAVSATDAFGALKRTSTPPAECDWGTPRGEATVSAPGVELYTTDRTGEAGYCKSGPHSDYTKFSGTSAAVPLVAGAAALMLSRNPGLQPLTIRTRLEQTSRHPHPAKRPTDIDPSDPAPWGLGWGRIDACNTLTDEPESCERSSP